VITNSSEYKSSSGYTVVRHDFVPDGTVRDGLVIVHGFGEHGMRYADLAVFLIEMGFYVCAVDLPGNGMSGGKRGDIDSYDSITAVIDETRNHVLENIPEGGVIGLYGHSLGGLLALSHYCLYEKNYNFAWFSSTLIRPGEQFSGLTMFLLKILSRVFPGIIAAKKLDARDLSRDQSVVEAYRDDPLNHDRFSLRLGMMLIELQKSIHDNPPGTEQPILVTHGTDDRICPLSYSQEYFGALDKPIVTWHPFEGGYHELHNDLCKKELYSLFKTWYTSTFSRE
jgi:acylglycerol lipase